MNYMAKLNLTSLKVNKIKNIIFHFYLKKGSNAILSKL
jgi:hypothetical protein